MRTICNYLYDNNNLQVYATQTRKFSVVVLFLGCHYMKRFKCCITKQKKKKHSATKTKVTALAVVEVFDVVCSFCCCYCSNSCCSCHHC